VSDKDAAARPSCAFCKGKSARLEVRVGCTRLLADADGTSNATTAAGATIPTSQPRLAAKGSSVLSRLPCVPRRKDAEVGTDGNSPGTTRTERRRSRTDLAVGCTTVRVLKTRWATGPGRSVASVAA
jgi:hypothetical protein